MNTVRATILCPYTKICAFQAPDGYGVPLAPDVFIETTEQEDDKKEEGARFVVRKTLHDGRVFYRDRLRSSCSSKKRCRHYVNGALHEKIPKGSYIFRPEVDGPCDIVVLVQAARPYTSTNGCAKPGCLPDATKFDFMEASHYLPVEPTATFRSSLHKRKHGDTSAAYENKEVLDTVPDAGGNLKFMKWYTERQTVVKVRFVGGDTNFARSPGCTCRSG